MEKLLIGMTRFQRDIFPAQQKRYKELSTGQQPHTLFIGCSDSRLMPNDLLQAAPGELFICRNAGNIVPTYSDNLGGVSATVEYAVQVLRVSHIVVCGHSDCGAMKAVIHPEKVQHLRAVSHWIRHAERASAVARELHVEEENGEFLDRVIEENVIAQLDNLMTHPCVAAKVTAGQVSLHGLMFQFNSGVVTMLDAQRRQFEPVADVAARVLKGEMANA